MLVFLAREAGHDVQDIQAEVSVDGIKGHLDATIDGVVVDAKSASSPSFRKFQEGDLKDDPFGYKAQLAGYAESKGLDGAFLAIDKQMGDMALYPIAKEELQGFNVKERIAHIREVIEQPEPPERCYEAKPMGESGNMALSVGCSYCDHRFECWADANEGKGLRTFIYSGKPMFLTKVVREPKVPEISFHRGY